jgi:hypothetical protein
MTNRPISIISGDILPSKTKSKLSKNDLDNIKGIFSSNVKQTAKSQDILDSGKHKETRGRVVGEKNPDIHEDWEKVATSEKLTMRNLHDTRSLVPSRSSETSEGGRGQLRSGTSSIFNPEALEDVRDSEYTESILDSARDRRMKERVKNNEWEVISAAKSTKDTLPSQMGFMPLKTSLPSLETPEVSFISTNKVKNEELGREALKIRQEINLRESVNNSEKLNDNRSWEDVTFENIVKNQSREMTIDNKVATLADDFVREPSKKIDMSLSGVFTIPPDPKEFKEANIRRDTSDLDSIRSRREDDRSWETVENSRSGRR